MCLISGCTSLAQLYHLCGKHGGYPHCIYPDCGKRIVNDKLCKQHGELADPIDVLADIVKVKQEPIN